MTPDRYYNFDVSWSDLSETVLKVWWDDVIHDIILPLSQEDHEFLKAKADGQLPWQK